MAITTRAGTALLLALLVAPRATRAQSSDSLPGMPLPLDPHDIYAADRPGNLSPASAVSPNACTSRTADGTPWT